MVDKNGKTIDTFQAFYEMLPHPDWQPKIPDTSILSAYALGGVDAITGEFWACEYEDCFEAVQHSQNIGYEWIQRKRCLRDLLEGTEQYFADNPSRKDGEFAQHFRERYRQAERLWQQLKGVKWERMMSINKPKNLILVNDK